MHLTLQNIVLASDGVHTFTFEDTTFDLDIRDRFYEFSDCLILQILPGVTSHLCNLMYDAAYPHECPGYKPKYGAWLLKMVDEINIRFNVNRCTLGDVSIIRNGDDHDGWSLSVMLMIQRGYTYYMRHGYLIDRGGGDSTMRSKLITTNQWLKRVNIDLDNVEITLDIMDCLRKVISEKDSSVAAVVTQALEFVESRQHKTPRDILKEAYLLYHPDPPINRSFSKNPIIDQVPTTYTTNKMGLLHHNIYYNIYSIFFDYSKRGCAQAVIPIDMVKYYKVRGRQVEMTFNEETRKFTSRSRRKTHT